MVRILKQWIGLPCRVKLLDHALNGAEIPEAAVYGVLKTIEKDRITVAAWDFGDDDPDLEEHNEVFHIARGAITGFKPWHIRS